MHARGPFRKPLITLLTPLLFLSSCATPPYNDYRPYSNTRSYGAAGAGTGTAVGALAGATGVGTAVGGAFGLARGHYLDSKKGLINELRRADIQIIEEHNQLTILVPTDKYYFTNEAKLNDYRHAELNRLVKLLRYYPKGDIFVAGFTDDIGSNQHKQTYSQNLAQAMTTFLWANGFKAKRMHVEGYADKHPIANNDIIHGAAMNRRVEIQWRASDSLVMVRKDVMHKDKFGKSKG